MKGQFSKLRIGYIIVLNGEHHLKHKDFVENLVTNMVDHLIIVEGAVDATIGSAKWSGQIPPTYQNNGRSVDGTVEYLQEMDSKHENLHVIIGDGFWTGKDEMINVAVDKAREIAEEYTSGFKESSFLWEIDSDEHWTSWKMDEIEREMVAEGADCVQVLHHVMMGKRLQGYGPHWGGNPCYRLWNWKGEKYRMHAPPILEGTKGNGRVINVHQRFVHYSYYFEKDMKFKGDWYYTDLNILPRWKEIQKYSKDKFPVELGYILPRYANIGSYIYKIPDKSVDFKWTRWLDVNENDKSVIENVDMYKVPVHDQNKPHNFSTLFNIGRQLFKYREGEIVIANYDKKYDYQVQIIKNGIDNIGMDYHTTNIENSSFDIVYINGDSITSEDVEDAFNNRKISGYIYISNYDKNESTIKLLIDSYFQNERFKEFFYIPCHNGACLIL